MGKLLRLRDYILIAAAAASEVFEDIRLVGGIVPKVMEGTYGFVPAKYRHSSYSSTVSQMLSTGDIRKIINRQGEVQLELTSVGEQQFKRRFKLFLQTHKWDGLFMMVIFDIAEKNRPARDQFRRKLEELGFGMLQKSVWISPYHFEDDMRESLVNQGLETEVFIFSGRRLLAGDLRLMASTTWKLSRINEKYQQILHKINESATSPLKNKRILNEAYQEYFTVLASDPLLPRELLPKEWLRSKVITTLNRL